MSQNGIPDWKEIGRKYTDSNYQETKPANCVEKNPPQVPVGGEVKKDLDKGVAIQKHGVPNQAEIIANQGEIKPASPWYVNAFNNGMHHLRNLGDNLLGMAGFTAKGVAMVLPVSCSKMDGEISAGVNVQITKQMVVDSTVKQLQKKEEGYLTSDGVKYQYQQDKDKKPFVQFNNGLTHYIGDDTQVKDYVPTGALYKMLDEVGMGVKKETKTSPILMDLKSDGGSYGNKAPGVDIHLVTPTDLKEITAGNPLVTGKIGDNQFTGKVQRVNASKEFKLEVNGQLKDNDLGGILIKNQNGDEIYLQSEKDFDLRSAADNKPNLYDGVVIYIKQKGSDVFKEHSILSKFEGRDGKVATDYGIIDRSKKGTTLQHYDTKQETFDANGANVADKTFTDMYDLIWKSYQAGADVGVEAH